MAEQKPKPKPKPPPKVIGTEGVVGSGTVDTGATPKPLTDKEKKELQKLKKQAKQIAGQWQGPAPISEEFVIAALQQGLSVVDIRSILRSRALHGPTTAGSDEGGDPIFDSPEVLDYYTEHPELLTGLLDAIKTYQDAPQNYAEFLASGGKPGEYKPANMALQEAVLSDPGAMEAYLAGTKKSKWIAEGNDPAQWYNYSYGLRNKKKAPSGPSFIGGFDVDQFDAMETRDLGDLATATQQMFQAKQQKEYAQGFNEDYFSPDQVEAEDLMPEIDFGGGGSSGGGSSSDGSSGSSGSSSSSSSSDGSSGPSLAEKRALQNLRLSYLELMRRWGLPHSKNLMNLIEKAARGQWSSLMFQAHLRHTPEYRQKYFGIQVKTGMTEGTYLSTFAQYKARAQDIGVHLTPQLFGRLLKRGVTFDEYSDRIDALQTFRSYQPMWNQFRVVLEERGIGVPGGTLGKKEMVKFIMGRGSKQWENVFQEVYLTTNLEKVAGISVVEPGKGETATPDTFEITRNDLLQIIKQVEGLSAGKFDVETLTPQNFAEIGQRLRKYNMSYLRRYGLTTKDLLEMELGGPNAAKIGEKANRILAEQEAFQAPRPQSRVPALEQQQPEELPQSL